MRSNKGFTLIELMIVVGIIGILSLIGLPIYNNYITKVKLTEMVTKHLHLVREMEIEFDSGGIDAAYSYIRGLCSSNVRESKGPPWDSLECDTTNIGLPFNGSIWATFYTESNTIDLQVFSSHSMEDSKLEYFWEQIFLSERDDALGIHRISYYPEDLEAHNGKRSSLAFYFTRENTNDGLFKIMDRDGSISSAEIGRWYCGTVMYNPKPPYIDIVPKSIRPSACKYSAIDGSSGFFMED